MLNEKHRSGSYLGFFPITEKTVYENNKPNYK